MLLVGALLLVGGGGGGGAGFFLNSFVISCALWKMSNEQTVDGERATEFDVAFMAMRKTNVHVNPFVRTKLI